MERQRVVNSMGVVYIVMLLGNLFICAISLVLNKFGIAMPSTLVTVLCEMAILLPTIVYLRSTGESISQSFGFHRIKITTVLLTVLLTAVTAPIYIFANLFSQLFVKNTFVQSSGELAEGSVILSLIVVSVLAPLCEEIAFRGFFFNRLKGILPVISAVAVSALMFGIMHLNLNQFCYAFVLGVVFALANHASGSTWTSVIMHFLINFVNTLLLIGANLSLKEQDIDLAQAQEATRQETGVMLSAVLIFGVIALACVFLVRLILKAIARNQGNLEAYKSSFARNDNTVAEGDVRVRSLMNVPMILSLLIGIAAMITFQVTVL